MMFYTTAYLSSTHTKDDRVSTQEQLADESLLVDGLGLLALASLRYLSPHLRKIK